MGTDETTVPDVVRLYEVVAADVLDTIGTEETTVPEVVKL